MIKNRPDGSQYVEVHEHELQSARSVGYAYYIYGEESGTTGYYWDDYPRNKDDIKVADASEFRRVEGKDVFIFALQHG